MKKIILFLLVLVSNCFSQYVPQFQREPSVGHQINLSHPDAKGLVFALLLNEGTGTTQFDLSPYGNDGSVQNMDPATDWVVGIRGYALDFDGSNDHLDFGGVVDVLNFDGLSPFSIFVTVKFSTSAAGGDQIIGNQVTGGNFEGWKLDLDGVEKLEFRLRETGSSEAKVQTTASTTFNDGLWHDIVATYDGFQNTSGMHIYVDGIDLALTSVTNTLSGSTVSTGKFTIATRNGADSFLLGQIESAFIWERELTQTDVDNLFSNRSAMFGQPPGRILAAAVAAAVRRREIKIF